MFTRFWNSLSSIGVQYHYDDKLIKRTTLTNQFGFIAFFVVMLGGIHNYFRGDSFSAILCQGLALIFLLIFYLNRRGLHKLATSLLLITVSLTIFYFSSYAGIGSGSYLFYFPLILAIGHLFDLNDRGTMAFHFLFNILLLLINNFTGYSLFRNETLSEEFIQQFFFFNLLFSVSCIGFFMYLTIVNNVKEALVFELRINERKATEEAIKQALSEKDILLAEIHHRVKNNLAIIASLFNLQIGTVENEEAKSILLESKNRVKSMALIHDRLYKSDRLSHIDFDKYTSELIDEIQYSYPTLSKNISVYKHVSNISLNVNNAIPCGLILNELLSNCYKHAFEGKDSGKIDITFTKKGNIFSLSVKDNGIGLKKDYMNGESLGMVVIQSLSDQLDGKWSFTVDHGTAFLLEFEQILEGE
jgi:two-component sensor histidine kinase